MAGSAGLPSAEQGAGTALPARHCPSSVEWWGGSGGLALSSLWAVALGITPLYRHDWMLENVLSVVAVILLLSTSNAWLQRDFAREWDDSLRVKHAHPLGEDEIRRMLEDNGSQR